MVVTLAEFYAARLDEREAAARAWLPLARLDGSCSWYDEVSESNLGPYSIEHARLHDPARVLREVEAGRRILARYERAVAAPMSVSGFVNAQDDGYREACLDTLRDLAEAHSGHPDYDEEWRP